MRFLKHIIQLIRSVYGSADPNLFGSKNRRKEKVALSDEFKTKTAGIETDILEVQSKNPFDSAAAKSAMTKASMGAKQMQKRFLNTMGANASPEALIAAQGATTKALGTAAGQIATGAEAMKKQEVSQLRGLKAGYEAQASGLQQAAINERGAGWRDVFSFLNPIGAMKGGIDAAQ